MFTRDKKQRVIFPCLCLMICLLITGEARADGYDWDVMTSASWQNMIPAQGIVTIHEVTKNGANVRETPDANAPMAGFVPMQTTYLCLSTASNGWRKILLPTGATGYVSGKLCDFYPVIPDVAIYSIPIGTVSVSSSRRTYAAPSSASDFMGSVSQGNVYPCVDILDDWYCIAVNHGKNGDWVVYVHRDGVRFTPLW